MAEYRINAKNKPLGRLASEIAVILQGKRNPNYEPKNIGEDKVFLENYKDISITGKKVKQKIYYRHTGYVGHLKERTLEQALEKDPKMVIRNAVSHMLPKNSLNSKRLKNLVFVDGNFKK